MNVSSKSTGHQDADFVFWFPCMWQRTLSAHLGRGRVTLLADPGVSSLLGGLLQWRVQAAEVIAETALITPEGQTDRQTEDHVLLLLTQRKLLHAPTRTASG